MSHLRRLSLVSVPALALSTLAFLPATPASAAEPDPTPVSHGADWLAGQLTDGLMHNDQFDFDDLGLTTDTGLAMASLGESDTAGDISDALATLEELAPRQARMVELRFFGGMPTETIAEVLQVLFLGGRF